MDGSAQICTHRIFSCVHCLGGFCESGSQSSTQAVPVMLSLFYLSAYVALSIRLSISLAHFLLLILHTHPFYRSLSYLLYCALVLHPPPP